MSKFSSKFMSKSPFQLSNSTKAAMAEAGPASKARGLVAEAEKSGAATEELKKTGEEVSEKIKKAKGEGDSDSPAKKRTEDPRDDMEPPTARAQKVKKRLSKKKGGNTAAVTRRINEGNIKGAKLQSRRARAKDIDRKRKLDRKTDVADQKFFEKQVERRGEK